MSLLQVEGVVKEYDRNIILDGVSLRVERGSKMALVGANGAGKTTLLRIICGYEKPDQGKVAFAAGTRLGYLSQNLEDKAAINDTPLLNPELAALEKEMKRLADKIARRSQIAQEVQIAQEIQATEETRQVHKNPAAQETQGVNIASKIQEALDEYSRVSEKFEALGGYTVRYRMAEILAGLGLPEDAINRPVSSFSGGERMRVAMARLLVMEPDLLLLDEPTNHLDLEGIEWLEEYLRSFKGGVLVVSHDRYFLDRVADRVACLEGGQIRVMSGGYTDFMLQEKIRQEYREKEMQKLEEELERQQEAAQTLRSHRKMASYHSREKVVAKLSEKLEEMKETLKRGRRAALKIRISATDSYSSEVITLSGLSKKFSSKELFSGLNLKIRTGDKIALVGPNGCGKTTLINLLMGKDSDFEGEFKVNASIRFAQMGQIVNFSSDNATILEEIMGAGYMGTEEARKYLALYGFRNNDVFKEIGVLSGGERSRLYLACVLLENPDCLILDEPTNHLDTYSREVLEEALINFNGTIIAASHDRYFLRKCFSRIAAFMCGNLREFDSFDDYRSFKDGPGGSASIASRGTTATAKTSITVAGAPALAPAAGLKGKDISKTSSKAYRPEEDGTSEKSDARKHGRVNRAEERRIAAARRARIKELEDEIMQMESRKKSMEDGFGKDTPPEEYEEYDRLLKKLDENYEEYVELQE